MTRNIFLQILFLIYLTSCGYQPIYSSKTQSNLKVKEIVLLGDNKINKEIISLIGIVKNSSIKTAAIVTFDTNKRNEISSKDNLGNPLTYQMVISTKFKINKKEKTFQNSFSYSNKENKFDLSEYQKTIEKNLIKSISESISIYLNLL